jgi:alpha-amylase/alpha-mannosidase (GH57 family)
MHPLSVAFVWHQHQPYYPDDVAGYNAMPWVRLHGTKDYWGMAMHLREVPEMQATINLVPSLVAQILAYTEGHAQDEHLRISRLPADSLSEVDRHFLLDHFFMANPDQMIRPYARYWELYVQRGLSVDSAARASRRFTTRDILDLQCLSNLVWLHPIAFERDAELAEFRAKGQHWTEDEKQWLLDKQLALLAEVVPLHRQLAERGQVELSTTPFYHPILPLLIDKRLARQAMPQVNLPRHLEGYPQDAADQIARAVAYHARIFGSRPAGMWPSEGSVAQAVIPLVAAEGIEWIASDEEILARSTEGWISRDSHGLVHNPEMLYRPWRVEEGGHKLQMIFRDHALSDQIGFHYQRYNSHQAADDLVGKLESIHRAVAAQGGQPAIVSIILDGENCWEYYAHSGLDFLRRLYQRLARHPQLKPARVCDYLEKHPADKTLGHLFAGSWISHNFGIWIGHPACNRAWDLLAEARAVLVRRAADKEVPPENLARAWEELYIAQGSDWFWWFDDQHSSGQDWLFDQLFRKHLQNVYTLAGVEPPAELTRPIGAPQRPGRPFTQPTSLLDVKIDGRVTYFEWLNAGEFVSSAARGTMTMAEPHRVDRLHFGFDEARLLLRFDTPGGVRSRLADVDTLRVSFVEPSGFELLVRDPSTPRPGVQLFHNDVPVSAAGAEAAADNVLEIAVPWRSLATATDALIHFYAELIRNQQPIERVPHEGAIETLVPSPDYELMMWQA